MPASVIQLVLRSAAIVIAIAGLVDPVTSVDHVPRRPVTVVTAVANDNSGVRAALGAAAGPNVVLRDRGARGTALPCGPDDTCVIIADGSVDLDTESPHGAPVSVVKVMPPPGPNVELIEAVVAARQHVAAAGSVHVRLAGSGVAGRTTELRVLDGSIVVGSATHEWGDDVPAQLNIGWWPIAEGARVLRVEAVPVVGEVAAFDNVIEAGVTVDGRRTTVLVFDPRPSWASTFVRRALEDDPRFTVRSRARLGPTLTAGTPAAALDAATLQSAAVVIVGAPDALGASEAGLLDRYLRVRGGTLVLLPDRPPSGASARLFPGEWVEHLTPVAESIGPLRAGEVLRRPTVDPTDVVFGESKGLPAIVMSPAGAGRVVVVGAMDAWRFRGADEGGGHDRFWRALAVQGGELGQEIEIAVTDTLAASGATLPVGVRVRRMQTLRAETIRAIARCDDGVEQTIRVWPAGEDGSFSGAWPIGDARRCRLDVAFADGLSATSSVSIVRTPVRGAHATLARLEQLAAATGGVTVLAGEERTLGVRLRGDVPPAVRTATRPMRSPWWMLPFAACLSAEWWLRRRSGLR